MGTEITCTDTETGESETRTIVDDWCLTVDGDRHEVSFDTYPTTGTTVITIKRAAAREGSSDG